MSDTAPQFSFVHVPERHRYEIVDHAAGDEVVGFATYLALEGTHTDFVHTEVSEAYGGQGLASKLVAFALADVRERGQRIIPECPYVAGWLRKHEGFEEITDWPEA